MQLSRKTLPLLNPQNIAIPADALFELPEKVLQFGTGVLLRGLPDYFIDEANKQNIFNGRIVVVKSTDTGGTDAFEEQDGLYTLLVRGVDKGIMTEKTVINASINRVLSAVKEWDAILDCAANPAMQVIISNTTEVGITLVEADAENKEPVSFPGRVLDFLQARYKAFNGSTESGMVIIPTELITDNGTKLKHIILKLAALKNLPPAFIDWLVTANDFCNSLVDCIVPGKLSLSEHAATEKQLGYEDQLMIMSEPYRLWAIEAKDERIREKLSFSKTDAGVVLAPDINKFRELKLRLLNGTHTLSCGLAYLSGFVTVKEAMADTQFASYVSTLMLEEIAPLVVSGHISKEETEQFAKQVIDRFKNPFIEHLWLNITVQYSSKIVMRTVPLLEKYYSVKGESPELMALGFAAFILFMRSTKKGDNLFYGELKGNEYRIQDDKAVLLYDKWQLFDKDSVIEETLKDTAIFGKDLSVYPGFANTVKRYLLLLIQQGAGNTIRSLEEKNK
jgi:tagaturonate reductase